MYLQCGAGDEVADYPDDLIWKELRERLATDGWELTEGEIFQKNIVGLRSLRQ